MPVNSNKSWGAGGGATTAGIQLPLSVADLDRIVQLIFTNSGGVADDYVQITACNKNVSGQYQVPSGKSLYMLMANTSPTSIVVGYGDTALGSQRTATPPTNPVYLASSGTAYSSNLFTSTAQMAGFQVFKIPAGKYPFFRTGNTGGATHNIGAILLDE